MALLEVNNLSVRLQTQRGPATAVRGISFSLERGETLGLIGESGCGKSITVLSLMGLLPESAQDPTACLGLDTQVMSEALIKGPEGPFGLAYARMGEWSYFVMLTPSDPTVESKEDIDKFIADTIKPQPEAPEVTPQIVH